MGVLAIIVFSLVACTPWHGVPNGCYSRLDENGNKIQEGAEGAWAIKGDKAEFRYFEYQIVEEEGRLFLKLIERKMIG
jgi:hypothetical protein